MPQDTPSDSGVRDGWRARASALVRMPQRRRSTLRHRAFASCTAGCWAALGLAVLGVLLLPSVRRATESSMTAHMLVQYAGLLSAGALMAGALAGKRPAGWRRALQACNELGIAGLLGSALTLAVLMLPRVLDLALVDARVEALKLAALVASGAGLRVSWQRAGTVVQAFFLGNVLPMMIVVGSLYQDSPTRLCNAYLFGDQRLLGLALVWIAGCIAAAWLGHWAWRERGAAARARA